MTTSKDQIAMRANRASGFSLIEVMIVIVIIGILASIALPAYSDHQRKARRAAGAACASAVAQRLERVYTTDLNYSSAPVISTLTAGCEADALTFYTYARTVGDKTYSVTAAPAGKQTGDSCGTLSIDQAGTKAFTGTGGKSCW